MLELKNVALTPPEGRHTAVFDFNIRPNVSHLPTMLEVPLTVTLDLQAHTATGALRMDDIQAENLTEVLDKAANWCDRTAAALRTVRRIPSDLPLFQRTFFVLDEQPSWVRLLYDNLLAELTATPGEFSRIAQRLIAENNPLVNLGGLDAAFAQVERFLGLRED